MTTYIEYGVKLTDGQKSKLASAILNKSPLPLVLVKSRFRVKALGSSLLPWTLSGCKSHWS